MTALAPRDLLFLAVLADGPSQGCGIIKAVEERSEPARIASIGLPSASKERVFWVSLHSYARFVSFGISFAVYLGLTRATTPTGVLAAPSAR